MRFTVIIFVTIFVIHCSNEKTTKIGNDSLLYLALSNAIEMSNHQAGLTNTSTSPSSSSSGSSSTPTSTTTAAFNTLSSSSFSRCIGCHGFGQSDVNSLAARIMSAVKTGGIMSTSPYVESESQRSSIQSSLTAYYNSVGISY